MYKTMLARSNRESIHSNYPCQWTIEHNVVGLILCSTTMGCHKYSFTRKLYLLVKSKWNTLKSIHYRCLISSNAFTIQYLLWYLDIYSYSMNIYVDEVKLSTKKSSLCVKIRTAINLFSLFSFLLHLYGADFFFGIISFVCFYYFVLISFYFFFLFQFSRTLVAWIFRFRPHIHRLSKSTHTDT